MRYEVWVRVAGMEFQLPYKSEHEANFMAGMVTEIQNNPNSVEWAVNDLEKGVILRRSSSED